MAEAIKAAQERTIKTFESLSEEQLNTQVHDDENDHWNARQVLAHIAGRAINYRHAIHAAELDVRRFVPPGFDIHVWNRERVSEQDGRSVQEMLAELGQIQSDLIKRVETLPDELLTRMVQRPQGLMPLSDGLIAAASTHVIAHIAVVEKALGLNGDTGTRGHGDTETRARSGRNT